MEQISFDNEDVDILYKSLVLKYFAKCDESRYVSEYTDRGKYEDIMTEMDNISKMIERIERWKEKIEPDSRMTLLENNIDYVRDILKGRIRDLKLLGTTLVADWERLKPIWDELSSCIRLKRKLDSEEWKR